MKKTFHVFNSIALLLLLLQFSCNRNLDGVTWPAADRIVITSFTGRILDEANAPLEGVTVTAGDKSAQTDINGNFRINNVRSSEQFGCVRAGKEGYFAGARTVYAKADRANFVTITLIKKVLAGIFDSYSPGIIQVRPGISIDFTNSSFNRPGYAGYSGPVEVYAAYLDPESDRFNEIMPGDLRGIRSDSQITALRSYGMLVVELQSGGHPLILSDGSKATINMSIPPGQQTSAPPTIPLWYFDADKGLWKEEGKAIRSVNTYTGEVSHFSFWNLDIPENFVYASMDIFNQAGHPVAYTSVKITNTSNMSYGVGKTDSTGHVTMWIPKNAPLEVTILNSCYEPLFTKQVGPQQADIHLGTINVIVPESGSLTINGTGLSCDNLPIADGIASVFLEGYYYRFPILNGAFSGSIIRCELSTATAEVSVADIKQFKESDPVVMQISTGKYETGEIKACKELSNAEYILFTIGSSQYSLSYPTDSARSYREKKMSWFEMDTREPPKTSLFITIEDTIAHNYNTTLSLIAKETQYQSKENGIAVNVTRYGKRNDFVELNFNGTVYTDTTLSTSYPLSGRLRMKRLY